MILVLGATTRNADEDGGDGSAAGITSRLEQEDGGANVVAVGGDDVCAVAGAVAVAVVVAAVAGVVGSMIPSSSSSSSSSSGGEGKVVAAAAAAAGAPPSASAGTLSPPFGTALSSGTVMTMGGGLVKGWTGIAPTRPMCRYRLVGGGEEADKKKCRENKCLLGFSLCILSPPTLSLSLSPNLLSSCSPQGPFGGASPAFAALSLSLSLSFLCGTHGACNNNLTRDGGGSVAPTEVEAPLLPSSLSLSLSFRSGGRGGEWRGGGRWRPGHTEKRKRKEDLGGKKSADGVELGVNRLTFRKRIT